MISVFKESPFPTGGAHQAVLREAGLVITEEDAYLAAPPSLPPFMDALQVWLKVLSWLTNT